MASLQREVLALVLSGDLEALQRVFERTTGPEESQEADPCGVTDEVGRNALQVAGMLGRSAMIRELVAHGARVDAQTVSGHSALHLAACWGRLDSVRVLLELGADPQARTFRGQRPVDMARANSRTACEDCLMRAEAQQDLTSYVDWVRDLVSDPERILTKEEKNICTRACSTKMDWIQSARSPAASDFTAQRRDLEDALRPLLDRLSAQVAAAEELVQPAGS